MPFEVFSKRMAPLAKAPIVTIQKRGIMSINRAAHHFIGGAETVELLYDKDERIIAIRPARDDSPNAYMLRPQSKRNETGQMVLSATAFTQFYRIDTTVSRRWTPYEQDGMLCIDLKGESSEIIGNRSSRSQEADGDD